MAVLHPAQIEISTCFSLNSLDAVNLVSVNILGMVALSTHAVLKLSFFFVIFAAAAFGNWCGPGAGAKGKTEDNKGP